MGGVGGAREVNMAHAVDFENVSTVGLESSPVAAALAGLRAGRRLHFEDVVPIRGSFFVIKGQWKY